MTTTHEEHPHTGDFPCCPQYEPCDVCDVLNFRYRLRFRPAVRVGGERRVIPVEVILHFRLTRCPGPLAQGDLQYTTTLLPGEKVRLFSSDRHTRFSFDTESKLSYRHQITSEESFFAAGMAHSMSNLSIIENVNKSSTFSESSVSGGGGLGIDLGIIELGGSASGSSYDSESTASLARTLTQHAEASSQHVETATRAASSTSVGEVSSRTHTESESEDHFESASRVFANPNRCHALTFFFYRVNKCSTLRWELVAIERRVEDPVSPTGVTLNPLPPSTGVAVLPSGILATSKERLDIQRMARTSLVEEQGSLAGIGATATAATQLRIATLSVPQEPIPSTARAAALAEVDARLVAQGLVDKINGEVSPEAKQRFSWERMLSLPTPGIVVKGCLDECDVCEPELKREIELELARKELENKLLERQIELLEKSQEYRCCPEETAETPAPAPGG